jgi:hypothetical protein
MLSALGGPKQEFNKHFLNYTMNAICRRAEVWIIAISRAVSISCNLEPFAIGTGYELDRV